MKTLRSKRASGLPSRMKPEWWEWPTAELGKRRPASHGRVEDHQWTLTRIAALIARLFHVRFSPAQTSRILRQTGWSVQTPQRRATERDENTVATWIKETWPQVKDGEGPGRVAVPHGRVGASAAPPPEARTWSLRGHTPVAVVRAAGSERISPAGLVCRMGEKSPPATPPRHHPHRPPMPRQIASNVQRGEQTTRWSLRGIGAVRVLSVGSAWMWLCLSMK